MASIEIISSDLTVCSPALSITLQCQCACIQRGCTSLHNKHTSSKRSVNTQQHAQPRCDDFPFLMSADQMFCERILKVKFPVEFDRLTVYVWKHGGVGACRTSCRNKLKTSTALGTPSRIELRCGHILLDSESRSGPSNLWFLAINTLL